MTVTCCCSDCSFELSMGSHSMFPCVSTWLLIVFSLIFSFDFHVFSCADVSICFHLTFTWYFFAFSFHFGMCSHLLFPYVFTWISLVCLPDSSFHFSTCSYLMFPCVVTWPFLVLFHFFMSSILACVVSDFPMGFQSCSHVLSDFPMRFQWFSRVFLVIVPCIFSAFSPCVFSDFRMCFQWFSHVFWVISRWVCSDLPICFQSFSHMSSVIFPCVSVMFSCVFSDFPMCFSDFPMCIQWFSNVFSMIFIYVFSYFLISGISQVFSVISRCVVSDFPMCVSPDFCRFFLWFLHSLVHVFSFDDPMRFHLTFGWFFFEFISLFHMFSLDVPICFHLTFACVFFDFSFHMSMGAHLLYPYVFAWRLRVLCLIFSFAFPYLMFPCVRLTFAWFSWFFTFACCLFDFCFHFSIFSH